MSVPSLDALSRERDRVMGSLPADLSGLGIGVYGAGFLGAWAIHWLRKNGIEPYACFDGQADKQGSKFHGVTVHQPAALASVRPDLVLITARHAVRSVAAVLYSHGVAGCSLDAYYVAAHFDDFLSVHASLLDDPRSRETLRCVLMAMLTGDPAPLAAVCEKDQYFCLPRFSGWEPETYVDAGAYVGDSLERFIWANAGAFKRIHAFEPGERQFASLETRVKRLAAEWALDAHAIVLNRAGLAEGDLRMSAATCSGALQSVSLAEAADGTVSAGSLDAYLGGEGVTFIKADVEGMELALLKGAAETISRFRPKLAVCVYHYPSDLPEIAAFIKGLVPAYRFALRHHAPRLMETVLYCWIE